MATLSLFLFLDPLDGITWDPFSRRIGMDWHQQTSVSLFLALSLSLFLAVTASIGVCKCPSASLSPPLSLSICRRVGVDIHLSIFGEHLIGKEFKFKNNLSRRFWPL